MILIVIDTLRADHVGSYGYSRDTTPNLDALSLHSTLYKRALSSAPWTMPAVGAIMTRDQWKLIVNHNTETIALYDLDADPGERDNLRADRPEIRDELQDLRRHFEGEGSPRARRK